MRWDPNFTTTETACGRCPGNLVLHEISTWKCKCYELEGFLSLFAVTFQHQQKQREWEKTTGSLIFCFAHRWCHSKAVAGWGCLHWSVVGTQSVQDSQPPHKGMKDFCTETINGRMILRKCPVLASSSKKKYTKTPCATSQWRGERKKRKRSKEKNKPKHQLLKLHQNPFLVHVNFLHKQDFAADWLLQVFFVYNLESL